LETLYLTFSPAVISKCLKIRTQARKSWTQSPKDNDTISFADLIYVTSDAKGAMKSTNTYRTYIHPTNKDIDSILSMALNKAFALSKLI
jgi:hypothetical protein